MFTGIVAAVGKITSFTPLGDAAAGLRVQVDAGGLDLSDVALGDSIAINGACMTVVEKQPVQLPCARASALDRDRCGTPRGCQRRH